MVMKMIMTSFGAMALVSAWTKKTAFGGFLRASAATE